MCGRRRARGDGRSPCWRSASGRRGPLLEINFFVCGHVHGCHRGLWTRDRRSARGGFTATVRRSGEADLRVEELVNASSARDDSKPCSRLFLAQTAPLHGRGDGRSRRSCGPCVFGPWPSSTDATSTARVKALRRRVRSFAPPEVTDDYLVDAQPTKCASSTPRSAAAPPTSPCGASTSTARRDSCSTAHSVANNPAQFVRGGSGVAAPGRTAPRPWARRTRSSTWSCRWARARRRRGRRRRRAPKFWGCCRRSRTSRPRATS